jgi:DNA-binding response OmpR family regulator
MAGDGRAKLRNRVNRELLLIVHTDLLRSAMRDWIELAFPGFTVLEAKDAAEAISLLDARSPRVILADVDGLRGDTQEAVRRIRAAFDTAPLVALAMDDYDVQRRAALEAGADAYVHKPQAVEELLPLLENLLDEAGPGDGTRTVVCIDDEPEILTLVALILERGPFEVVGTLDGQEGLDIARRIRPDLVLLDLMLPGMDGWEVAQRLRADPTLNDVPIIAVSVVRPDSYPGRELPVDDYVRKPFQQDDLLRRVSDAARVPA